MVGMDANEPADRTNADAAEELRLARLAGPVPLALTPTARRRALVAGAVSGPFATSGLGFTTVGASAALESAGGGPWFPSTWVFLGVGIACLVIAVVAASRLTRSHHRAGLVTVGGVALTALPFLPAAPGVVAWAILTLAVGEAGVAPVSPALVFLLAWGALALIGLVVGPLAFWLVAHLGRSLPSHRESDPDAVARYRATTVRVERP